MTKKKQQPSGRAQKLVDVVRKSFGKHAALVVGGEIGRTAQIRGYLPTGLDVLDQYVIGRGGLPEGRLSELYSEAEGAVKTALLYLIMGAVQRAGGIAVEIDAEHSFDEERARLMGVDLDDLVMLRPDHLEALFEQVKATVDAHDGKVPLFVGWDSVASTNTKAGYALEAGDAGVAEVARIMSQELKKLLGRMHDKRAHLMMLNQVRAKPGVMFGPSTVTPGGNAIRFYSSVRLSVLGGKKIVNSVDEHTGKVVTIMAMKNRLAPPFRKARVRFDYDAGFDNEWSTIEHALTVKAIKSGNTKPRGRKAYEEACAALGWKPRPAAEQNEEPAQDPVVEFDDQDRGE